MNPLRISGYVALLFLSGCASTQSVSEMKEIQDNRGFYTKSLYYTGSTKHFHHFDQFTLFDQGRIMAALIPGAETDGHDHFKVSRAELSIPSTLEFDRKSYEGVDDERRTKIRIKDDPRFKIERRKTDGERFAEKYPDGINFSNAQVIKESDGSHVLVFGTPSSHTEADNKSE